MGTSTHIKSTAALVALLKKEDELLEIDEEIDPYLELAEIQRRVVAQNGKALLFNRVKGTNFKVATNLFGSRKRIELAFSTRPVDLLNTLKQTIDTLFPMSIGKMWRARNLAVEALKVGCKNVRSADVLSSEITNADLTKLPQIHCWPNDGGAFITLPLVYTQSPVTGRANLGMYRIQIFNSHECGMHIQIHRGGGFHYYEAEQKSQPLPVHIYIGGPPSLILAAIAPLPEGVSELLLASFISGSRIRQCRDNNLSPLPILADADFMITGEIPPYDRRAEGPFGDHYGYYSQRHDYPFVRVKQIFHRKNAIYPATVVGRPPQEDHYITCYLQDLLKPLIHMVMPQVKDLWAFEESGVHSLAVAVVNDRYPREALSTALRILGEGQLGLSKVLMVTDQPCDVRDFKSFFQIILERIDFSTDLFVLSNISQDSLDYTGPKVNEGSKAIFLGLGAPARTLPREFQGALETPHITDIHVFCAGALVVSGKKFEKNDGIPEMLAKEKALSDWPIVFLVDSAKAAALSTQDFLWHIFTRFEPAADIYAKKTIVHRFHIGLKTPIVIDCRMKPWYPAPLEPDPTIIKKLGSVLGKYGL
ncbi:MAG: UbiD family decarboxylase [Deltaproteobacteria bacterium]|nr:UbiD family decarboxylase [Deltaproteobacteria bacterium]